MFIQVVVSNIFLFSPLPGEMIQFDEHIFQRGWFNHQLVKRLIYIYICKFWVKVMYRWQELIHVDTFIEHQGFHQFLREKTRSPGRSSPRIFVWDVGHLGTWWGWLSCNGFFSGNQKLVGIFFSYDPGMKYLPSRSLTARP